MESKYNYFKRDISWLSFNYRVLMEALDEHLPLYERINFISIYSSNLEEFYKIRVADHKAVASGATESDEETEIFVQRGMILVAAGNTVLTSRLYGGDFIKKENIIEIPSIILPIKPEGDEAVVIDTSSEELGAFMKEFYGQNAEFFNQRNNATYSSNYNGFSNYTGLDLDKIEYKQENVKCIVNVDKLAVDTVWLFTDLKNLKLEPMQCKVIIYAPRSITEQELKELKELGDVTVITIDRM